MEFDEFKTAIAKAPNEEEIDALCFEWLRNLVEYHGADGRVARKLLKIVEQIITE